jgi:UPF0716 protein FxsA
MSLKWIIITILALPVAELGVYLVVAAQIGFLQAFLLQLLCSAAGLFVLQRTGKVRLARWKAGLRAGAISGLGASAGGAEVAGGILLFVPGFITDAVGVALLVPPLRRALAALIRHILTRYGRSPDSDAVIDLEPSQWREIETRKPANKPARKRRP